MTQYVSVAHIRSDVFIIMLHIASMFEIVILSHTSLVEGIREGSYASLVKTRGQDMCTHSR